MKTRNDGVFTMEPQTKGDLVSIKIIYNSGVSDQYQRVSFGDAVKLIAQYRKILDNGRKYKCHFIQASSSITLDLRLSRKRIKRRFRLAS